MYARHASKRCAGATAALSNPVPTISASTARAPSVRSIRIMSWYGEAHHLWRTLTVVQGFCRLRRPTAPAVLRRGARCPTPGGARGREAPGARPIARLDGRRRGRRLPPALAALPVDASEEAAYLRRGSSGAVSVAHHGLEIAATTNERRSAPCTPALRKPIQRWHLGIRSVSAERAGSWLASCSSRF